MQGRSKQRPYEKQCGVGVATMPQVRFMVKTTLCSPFPRNREFIQSQTLNSSIIQEFTRYAQNRYSSDFEFLNFPIVLDLPLKKRIIQIAIWFV